MLQSDYYYKSHAVGVTSEVGLITDGRPFRVVSMLLSVVLEKKGDFYTSTVRATVQHNISKRLCGDHHAVKKAVENMIQLTNRSERKYCKNFFLEMNMN